MPPVDESNVENMCLNGNKLNVDMTIGKEVEEYNVKSIRDHILPLMTSPFLHAWKKRSLYYIYRKVDNNLHVNRYIMDHDRRMIYSSLPHEFCRPDRPLRMRYMVILRDFDPIEVKDSYENSISQTDIVVDNYKFRFAIFSKHHNELIAHTADTMRVSVDFHDQFTIGVYSELMDVLAAANRPFGYIRCSWIVIAMVL